MNGFTEGKAYLMQLDREGGGSLYDHLSDVVLKVLENRPIGALSKFEDISLDVKKSKLFSFSQESDSTSDVSMPVKEIDPREQLVLDEINTLIDKKKQKKQKDQSKDGENDENEDGGDDAENGTDENQPLNEGELSNLLDDMSVFEYLGVGLSKEDTFRLFLSIKSLLEHNPLKNVRFFGKIFGTQGNYYVVESEFKDNSRDDEDEKKKNNNGDTDGDDDENSGGDDDEEENANGKKKKGNNKDDDGDDDNKEFIAIAGNRKFPNPLNKRYSYYQPPIAPTEDKIGPNKYVYWVCNRIGEKWKRLPDVTPAQLIVSRKIRKLLTGNLESKIECYPPFPDNPAPKNNRKKGDSSTIPATEANYLRAILARISAGTMVAPKGYYNTLELENEELGEDDIPPPAEIEANLDYQAMDASELLSAENWVHTRPHILSMGRERYWKAPKPPKFGSRNQDGGAEDREDHDEDEDEEEQEEQEEEEQEEEEEGTEIEMGPTMLSSVSEDEPIGKGQNPAWLARQPTASLLSSSFSPCFLISNRWVGAYAFSHGNKIQNVYFGNGMKEISNVYVFDVPPMIMQECEQPSEAKEATWEEEKAEEEAKKPPPPKEADEGEEEQEEEGEDGDGEGEGED